jgi:hypothetical protein
MILPEESKPLGYSYNPNDFTEVYYFGDFMRKTTHLLKDSDDKWKLACRATDIQSTEHTSLDAYRKTLQDFEKQLTNHIATNQDPFTL